MPPQNNEPLENRPQEDKFSGGQEPPAPYNNMSFPFSFHTGTGGEIAATENESAGPHTSAEPQKGTRNNTTSRTCEHQRSSQDKRANPSPSATRATTIYPIHSPISTSSESERNQFFSSPNLYSIPSHNFSFPTTTPVLLRCTPLSRSGDQNSCSSFNPNAKPFRPNLATKIGNFSKIHNVWYLMPGALKKCRG